MFIPRMGQLALLKSLQQFPSVAITGPRQSGKSTLLAQALPNSASLNLDLLTTRESLQENRGILSQSTGTLILDEIQKMPSLLEEIKVLIDAQRDRKGQFALTGSEQFQLMRGLQESLAGRLALLKLYPLAWQELESCGRLERTKTDLSKFVVQGGYPELWKEDGWDLERSHRWFESYISLYIERDICSHFGVQHASQFFHFLRLLALRSGQLLNIADLSRDSGMSVPTLREWISILERSFIIATVKPFFANLTKRLVKMPKIYFLDTGLLCYLVGLDSVSALDRHPLRGSIYENAVFSELLKRTNHLSGIPSIFFFRTHEGHEVDFIVERGINRIGIEVKRSGSATSSDAKILQSLMDANLLRRGIVMTLQADRHPVAPFVEACPFWDWSILDELTALPGDR